MKGGTQRVYRAGLALQLHRENHRKIVKKVGRKQHLEAVARYNAANRKRTLSERVMSVYNSLKSKLFNLFGYGVPKWNTITFRTHTPRVLSPEERADRVAHRKQIRHNRQRLINKRGYA